MNPEAHGMRRLPDLAGRIGYKVWSGGTQTPPSISAEVIVLSEQQLWISGPLWRDARCC
jgi:hypothetical protein